MEVTENQSNAEPSETLFAMRPEVWNGCQFPTLYDYQEVLKKYNPGSNLPSMFNFQSKEELRHRIDLVSQLLNGNSVDYKAAGLQKCHLDGLKEMFESTYAQGRVFSLVSHMATIGSPHVRAVYLTYWENAVTQFLWENPNGTTSEGGTFLAYALETDPLELNNLLGK